MADFTPITTQEELDAVLRSRLERERKKYEDYDKIKTDNEALQGKITELLEKSKTSDESRAALEKQIAEQGTKIKAFEVNALKTKIAQDLGLGVGAVGFLQGEDEESIRAHAEELKKWRMPREAPPYKPDEGVEGDDTRAAMRKIVKELRE